MFGLKSVYFYLIACQITLIKLFKKIYFSSKNYNKSLETVIPQQVYHSPNPFLLSIISPYNKSSFKINDINPNDFWLENKKDKIYYESKENSCGKLKSFIKKNKTSFIIFDSNWLNDFKISQLRKLSRVIVLSDTKKIYNANLMISSHPFKLNNKRKSIK